MAVAKRKRGTAIDPREKVFLDLISILWTYTDRERRKVADEAGVSISTINSWLYGTTLRPWISTLAKVAKPLGYEIALRRIKGSPRRVK